MQPPLGRKPNRPVEGKEEKTVGRPVREISISGYMMTSLIIASWTFEEKSVFATLLRAVILVPFIYAMRPRVICKGTSEEHVKQKKDGVRLCNAEKDLPKVNSTVVFLMHSESILSGVVFEFLQISGM